MAHGRVFAKPPVSVADIEEETGYVFEWAHPIGVLDGSGVMGIYKIDDTGTITDGATAKIIERGVYVVRAASDDVWPSMLDALKRALKRHFEAHAALGGRLSMLVKPGTIIETRAMPLLSLKI